MDELVESRLATRKPELRGQTTDGEELIGRPFDWLQRWPLRFEMRTVHLDRGEFARYEHRVKGMARLYNEGVERLLYGNEVRNAFGMRWAARAYVPMGFTVTALYGKVRAGSRFGTALLGAVFGFFHMWIHSWVGLARLVNLVDSRRRPGANRRSSA
jgi:hypothetical protein